MRSDEVKVKAKRKQSSLEMKWSGGVMKWGGEVMKW